MIQDMDMDMEMEMECGFRLTSKRKIMTLQEDAPIG